MHRACNRAGPAAPALGGKALTTFSAATLNNLAAIRSGHAGTEAVGTLALDNTGLERSFHDSLPEIRRFGDRL